MDETNLAGATDGTALADVADGADGAIGNSTDIPASSTVLQDASPQTVISLLKGMTNILIGGSSKTPSSSKVYYVDPEGGNDANTGLDRSLPVKSYAKVNALPAAYGDTIAFKSGTIAINTDLTEVVCVSGVNYTSYGSGSRPILTKAVTRNNVTDWTDTGKNVWKTPAPLDVGSILGNRKTIFGIKVWSLADVNSLGKFYYDGATHFVYYYCSSNPATYNGGDVILVLKQSIFKLWTQNNVSIRNLEMSLCGKFGVDMNGAVGIVHDIAIQNNSFTWIGGCEQDAHVRFGNGVQIFRSASNVEVSYNYFYQIYDSAFTTQGQNAGDILRNINQHHNIVDKCCMGYEAWGKTETCIMEHVYCNDNIFMNTGKEWSHLQRPVQNGMAVNFGYFNLSNVPETGGYPQMTDITVLRNQLTGATQSLLRVKDRGILKFVTIDYNTYDNGEAGMLVSLNGSNPVPLYHFSKSDFVSWQSMYHQDVHSRVV